MGKPVLLDLFSGAGGAARGYQMAGFSVVGIDHKPQPRYAGDEFHQADALEFVAKHGREFDAIHASPPCQAFTALRTIHKREYPNLIPAARAVLIASGRPYVIENVPRSPLLDPLVLCGAMFGLKVYRHRLFESNLLLFGLPHPAHVEPTIQRSWRTDWTGFVTVAGGHNVPKAQAAAAMGISWMSRDELSQAIPPAYCHFVGAQLRTALANSEAA